MIHFGISRVKPGGGTDRPRVTVCLARIPPPFHRGLKVYHRICNDPSITTSHFGRPVRTLFHLVEHNGYSHTGQYTNLHRQTVALRSEREAKRKRVSMSPIEELCVETPS